MKFKKGEKVLVEAKVEKEFPTLVDVEVMEYTPGEGITISAHKNKVHPYTAQNNWIPIDERLPEIKEGSFYTTVIVTVKGGLCFPLIFNGNKFFEPQMGGEIVNVIAWQPLPEPYEQHVKFEEGDLIENIKTGARMFYSNSKDKKAIWVVSVAHSKEMGVCWPISECRKVNND